MSNPMKLRENLERGEFEQVPTYLLMEPRLTPSEFRILLYFFVFKKQIAPSYHTIAEHTGISLMTIANCVKSLEAASVLVVTAGAKGRSSSYKINMPSQWDLEGRESRAARGPRLKDQAASRRVKTRARAIENMKAEIRREIEAENADKIVTPHSGGLAD